MSSLMEYKGYHGKVEYSAEEKLFHGRVIDIDDTIAFAGASVDELEKTFKSAIDGYVEWYRKAARKGVQGVLQRKSILGSPQGSLSRCGSHRHNPQPVRVRRHKGKAAEVLKLNK